MASTPSDVGMSISMTIIGCGSAFIGVPLLLASIFTGSVNVPLAIAGFTFMVVAGLATYRALS